MLGGYVSKQKPEIEDFNVSVGDRLTASKDRYPLLGMTSRDEAKKDLTGLKYLIESHSDKKFQNELIEDLIEGVAAELGITPKEFKEILNNTRRSEG